MHRARHSARPWLVARTRHVGARRLRQRQQQQERQRRQRRQPAPTMAKPKMGGKRHHRDRGRDHRRAGASRGAARRRRHPGRRARSTTPRRARRRTQLRAVPRDAVTPNEELHGVDDPRASGHQVPRRHPARPPRSSRTTSTPTPARPTRRTCCSCSSSTPTTGSTTSSHRSDDGRSRPEEPVGRRSRRTSTRTAAWAWRPRPSCTPGRNCFKNMIGTGPFKFNGDWVVGDHLTVVKNPNYWRKDKDGEQLPYLDKITFKPVDRHEPARERHPDQALRPGAHRLGRRASTTCHAAAEGRLDQLGSRTRSTPRSRTRSSTPRSRRSTTSTPARRTRTR